MMMMFEVQLDHGQVVATNGQNLPDKARALLTILEPPETPPVVGPAAGLQRFLSAPDFPLSAEQFRASMEADFFEQ